MRLRLRLAAALVAMAAGASAMPAAQAAGAGGSLTITHQHYTAAEPASLPAGVTPAHPRRSIELRTVTLHEVRRASGRAFVKAVLHVRHVFVQTVTDSDDVQLALTWPYSIEPGYHVVTIYGDRSGVRRGEEYVGEDADPAPAAACEDARLSYDKSVDTIELVFPVECLPASFRGGGRIGVLPSVSYDYTQEAASGSTEGSFARSVAGTYVTSGHGHYSRPSAWRLR